ncbi:LytR/AlgR family response regulator transcription factor [Niabella ginsengisoli]|uniref:LytTR family DNA-binding domain-containing protein n=1 Tax=Niabella ginsengisoli TaxID=522298 RepID=A0ABS9SP30_9BACT|nr:LytTR family DNA-binding domain-containing protein [Niabella ginsengisoli]MCH5600143.1 LytTR family DNA-binding domain-containing protein [Niabella ginsengisoli]
MNAIIVDDEQHNIENLKHLLQRHCSDIKIVATADNIQDALPRINSAKPDIIFLDIQLGNETGFELLKQLPQRDFEVIFVTAYDHYGIQAVKFAALDYILKPIDTHELIAAVEKASQKINNKKANTRLDFLIEYVRQGARSPSKIALPQQNEIRYIEINSIVRCEANNTYTWFYLDNKEKILVSKPLKEFEELLTPHGFLRTHQTHLINPAFVKSLQKSDGGFLLMQDGEKIPISKTKKETVKIALGKNI